jgi:ATP-dependent helicase/nuclease subunit A
MTPAELLDAALRETAYAYELRGPRRRQARENLKKLRGLVRRIENRGYSTVQRIADRLEQLAVGDESNASIDAVDAVSLMTVHAAKGLEFPIVFVVNLGRGTGGRRAPIRVVTGADGEASVAIADFQSEADDETQAREREETKRLLYVALTRARDRLYLAATVQDGGCRIGRGSLGEVLPPSLVALIAAAADRGRPALTWTAGEGRSHVFVACHAPEERGAAMPAAQGAARMPPTDDFGAIAGPPPVARVPVRQYVATSAEPLEELRAHQADEYALLAGTLAHRLFQLAADIEPAGLRQRAREWLTENEAGAVLVDHGAIDAVIERAVRWGGRLRGDARVAGLLANGRAFYEVPFALSIDEGTIVRGSIDCLVRGDDGRIAVVELKTGLRRPEHESQLQVYVEAARALFPEASVSGLLVYADD